MPRARGRAVESARTRRGCTIARSHGQSCDCIAGGRPLAGQLVPFPMPQARKAGRAEPARGRRPLLARPRVRVGRGGVELTRDTAHCGWTGSVRPAVEPGATESQQDDVWGGDGGLRPVVPRWAYGGLVSMSRNMIPKQKSLSRLVARTSDARERSLASWGLARVWCNQGKVDLPCPPARVPDQAQSAGST